MNEWFFYKASRALCRMALTIFFDYKAYNVDYVPRRGGVLMVSNHESFADPVLVGVQVPRIISYMAKSELFDNSLFGWYIRRLHAFPVKQGRGDISAVRETIDRLREGRILNIFPEGSRTEDGTMAPLQSGAALIIRRAQVPVVPVVIVGSFYVWPRNRVLPRLGRLRVLYGAPMLLYERPAAEITAKIDRALRQLRIQLEMILIEEDRRWPRKLKR